METLQVPTDLTDSTTTLLVYTKYITLPGNREFIMEAVKQHGVALQYASEELKRDRDVVMAAVRQNGDALQYASEELKRDRDVVMAAVRQNGDALQYANEEFRVREAAQEGSRKCCIIS